MGLVGLVATSRNKTGQDVASQNSPCKVVCRWRVRSFARGAKDVTLSDVTMGCRMISAQQVGSCCSKPDWIVCQAFIMPCHRGDLCLTRFRAFIIQFECTGHLPILDCRVWLTRYRTRTFQGSYPLERPRISCFTSKAEACHCGSKILTPPHTMGRTAVSHFTLALAHDSRFPDQM